MQVSEIVQTSHSHIHIIIIPVIVKEPSCMGVREGLRFHQVPFEGRDYVGGM